MSAVAVHRAAVAAVPCRFEPVDTNKPTLELFIFSFLKKKNYVLQIH